MNAPAHLTQTGRRADPRLRLCLPAELLMLDGLSKCWVENLSSSGARLAVAHQLRRNSNGFLRCAGLELFITVVWMGASRCGVRFDQPLPAATLFAIRQQAESYSAEERQRNNDAIRDWVAGRSRIV